MNLTRALTRLAGDPAAALDLAEVGLLLARDEYPDLDVDGYLAELTAMAREAKRLLRGSFTARVAALCRYLYHDLGFRGNRADYYDPRNSYLNEVIDRRTGIPIALSAVAIAVGQRAGMNVVGLGLPGHFVVMAEAGGQEIIFDPFHGGRVMSREECGALVGRVTGQETQLSPEAFHPATLGTTVVRMLTNLKGIYLKGGEFSKAVRVMKRLRQLQPDDPYQQRDLGAALLHAGKPGQALAHLTAFLDSSPPAQESAEVQLFIDQARAELARWN